MVITETAKEKISEILSKEDEETHMRIDIIIGGKNIYYDIVKSKMSEKDVFIGYRIFVEKIEQKLIKDVTLDHDGEKFIFLNSENIPYQNGSCYIT